MRQYIYKILEHQVDLALHEIVGHIVVAALIGVVIFISYLISHKGTIYSKKFNVSLVVLTVLTSMVMTVIGSNIALSLGMVGALSIVRFRTAIKDSRDTVYIFWAIIVGICTGVGSYAIAAVGSAMVFIILLFFGSIKNDNRILLIIHGERTCEQKVMSLVFKMFNRKAILRVKNSTADRIEFIYEISNKLLSKAEKNEVSVTNAIHSLEGIEYVNIVMQNDEIVN